MNFWNRKSISLAQLVAILSIVIMVGSTNISVRAEYAPNNAPNSQLDVTGNVAPSQPTVNPAPASVAPSPQTPIIFPEIPITPALAPVPSTPASVAAPSGPPPQSAPQAPAVNHVETTAQQPEASTVPPYAPALPPPAPNSGPETAPDHVGHKVEDANQEGPASANFPQAMPDPVVAAKRTPRQLGRDAAKVHDIQARAANREMYEKIVQLKGRGPNPDSDNIATASKLQEEIDELAKKETQLWTLKWVALNGHKEIKSLQNKSASLQKKINRAKSAKRKASLEGQQNQVSARLAASIATYQAAFANTGIEAPTVENRSAPQAE